MFRSFFKRKRASSPVIINAVDDDYIVDFCLQWNLSYPIDRWWRNKHKVAFNSPEHRVVSFIDMRFEFEEEMMFKRNMDYNLYVPNKGEFMKATLVDDDSNLTDEERLEKYKKEFEKMDLDQYND